MARNPDYSGSTGAAGGRVVYDSGHRLVVELDGVGTGLRIVVNADAPEPIVLWATEADAEKLSAALAVGLKEIAGRRDHAARE